MTTPDPERQHRERNRLRLNLAGSLLALCAATLWLSSPRFPTVGWFAAWFALIAAACFAYAAWGRR